MSIFSIFKKPRTEAIGRFTLTYYKKSIRIDDADKNWSVTFSEGVRPYAAICQFLSMGEKEIAQRLIEAYYLAQDLFSDIEFLKDLYSAFDKVMERIEKVEVSDKEDANILRDEQVKQEVKDMLVEDKNAFVVEKPKAKKKSVKKSFKESKEE